MSQSSAIAATTDGELLSPEGTQEGRNTCRRAAITAATLDSEALKKLRILAPERGGA